MTKRNDKYSYFPFVSGDLIEKHRATLGAQLKNDLQSYLDYSKKTSTRNPAQSVDYNSNDAGSVKSFYKSGASSLLNS